MRMNNDTYDVMKWVVMLALPALSTLINSLGAIWGLALAPQLADTVVAINAALAMMLGISSINYHKDGR